MQSEIVVIPFCLPGQFCVMPEIIRATSNGFGGLLVLVSCCLTQISVTFFPSDHHVG